MMIDWQENTLFAVAARDISGRSLPPARTSLQALDLPQVHSAIRFKMTTISSEEKKVGNLGVAGLKDIRSKSK